MTTWLKKLRLYLLRRQLRAVNRRMTQIDATEHPYAWLSCCDFRADLFSRIADLEKSLP